MARSSRSPTRRSCSARRRRWIACAPATIRRRSWNRGRRTKRAGALSGRPICSTEQPLPLSALVLAEPPLADADQEIDVARDRDETWRGARQHGGEEDRDGADRGQRDVAVDVD